MVNLIGKTFINPQIGLSVSCPFQTIDTILQDYSDQNLDAIVIDLHAETTSEKQALGFYVDGRVSLLVGTHTHVPTADQRILPQGTAYVTDVGMVGPLNSVLGVKKEIIWDLLRYPQPQRFEWVKKGKAVFHSVIVEVKGETSSVSIERKDLILEEAVT